MLDVFLVGGGDSGIRGNGSANGWKYAGDGGGGGYTKMQRNIGIAGGQVLRFNVGGGGGFVAGLAYNQSGQRTFNAGGVSSVVRSGSVLATVNGGNDFNGGGGGGGCSTYKGFFGASGGGGAGGSGIILAILH